MRSRFRQHINDLTSSFWFIPALLTVVALLLVAGALWLDFELSVSEWARENPVLFTGGEGARNLLATIAGSAISVAGVVFSITILVLNMASTQFGPGLLANFMHHRGTQVVLGAFVGTFTYCLIVLRFVDEEAFVPHIAVNVGMVLGLVSFFLLIFFIHHVSIFVRVARVIDDVATNMETALRNSFPERNRHEERTPDDEERDARSGHSVEEGLAVAAKNPGYVLVIEHERIVDLARKRGVSILLFYRPGQFVIPGTAFARASPADSIDDEFSECLRKYVVLGPERSVEQDPEFAVQQLVQIALRSLSPAINDPFTAYNCLHRLGAALALLATRRLPSRYLEDEEGTVRLIVNALTYKGIVNAAFSPIRQAAAGRANVVLYILDVISELATLELPEAFRDALLEQLKAIRTQNDNGFRSATDQDEYERLCRKAERALISKA